MSFKTYFQESFQELHQVSWPTRRQAVKITVIVFIFMLISAAILGVTDELLSLGYRAMLTIDLL